MAQAEKRKIFDANFKDYKPDEARAHLDQLLKAVENLGVNRIDVKISILSTEEPKKAPEGQMTIDDALKQGLN